MLFAHIRFEFVIFRVITLLYLFRVNIATVTTTPTTPGLLTTYPPPELLYAKTTDYHWPNFEKKMSKHEGKYDAKKEGLSDGPFGFGKSVKLKAGIKGEQDEVNFHQRVVNLITEFKRTQ